MNWKDWYYWKRRKFIAAILFGIAYILTIPIRGFEFSLWEHLIVIIIGMFFVMMLHSIIEIIVKKIYS
jgi:4-hydroxybenzoate polyprenyltransferase